METLELTEQVLESEEGSIDGNTHQSVCGAKKSGLNAVATDPLARFNVSNHSCTGLTRGICGWWDRLWADFTFPDGGLRWSFTLFHHYQLNLSWIRSILSPPSLKMLSFRGDRFNFLTSSRLRSQTCISICRQLSATESRRNEDRDDTEMPIQRDVITALPAGTRGRGHHSYSVGAPSISGGNL